MEQYQGWSEESKLRGLLHHVCNELIEAGRDPETDPTVAAIREVLGRHTVDPVIPQYSRLSVLGLRDHLAYRWHTEWAAHFEGEAVMAAQYGALDEAVRLNRKAKRHETEAVRIQSDDDEADRYWAARYGEAVNA